MTADVKRGRELIRQHGSVRAALKATHPDTSGYESVEDFRAIEAARSAPRPAPAGSRFVVWPPDLPLPGDAPGCVTGLDDALERARGMTGDLTVTQSDGRTFRARLVNILTTRGQRDAAATYRFGDFTAGGTARLVFDQGAPVVFEHARVADAAYIDRDGSGELRVGFVDGTGLMVATAGNHDVDAAVTQGILDAAIEAGIARMSRKLTA